MPYLNPARSLGPSFVLNKWDNHWVYWFGPLVGGLASGIIYEYVFNSRRGSRFGGKSGVAENDSSSIHSDDELNYDVDIDKPTKYQQGSGTYQRGGGKLTGNAHGPGGPGVTMGTMTGGNYCQNLYTAPPPLSKFDQPEPLYGGTRSMYCRSPTLTRTNLNRSQSVYTKSNTAINRDIVPRPGPLVPAQSLYPIRVSQQAQQAAQSHLQNQNVQNQMQQRSESIYGIRNSTRTQAQPPTNHHAQQVSAHQQQQQQQQQHHQHQQQQQQMHHHHQQQQQQQQQQQHVEGTQVFQSVYGSRQNPTPLDGNVKYERRPESVYGMSTVPRNRGQSAQSDDSSYGSYHGSAVTPPARNVNGEPMLMYVPPPQPGHVHQPPQTSQQQQTVPQASQQVMRTQSERKVSAPVVVSSHQPPLPPTSMTMTYTTSQIVPPPPSSTPQQQQQQQQQQMILSQQQQSQTQQQQQQQHYNLMAIRPN